MVRRGSRRWADAVPAMVTRIREATDTLATVDLVIPNLLSLRCGFGSAKPFCEMPDVSLKDLRAYTGSEQTQLKDQLVKAIRIDCRTRCASPSGALIITAKRPGALPLPATLPPPLPKDRAGTAIPTAADGGWEFLRHFDPADFTEESTSKLASAVDYDKKDGEGSQPKLETLPQEEQEAVVDSEADPATPCQRQLVRQDTPPTPSDVCSHKKRPTVIAELPCAQDASWLLEFTRGVSRAFRQTRQDELTQQELVALMAEAEGMKLSHEELQEGLRALDSQNKVFLTGDLVILIS